MKYVILESGGGWIAHWLERMDGKYKVGKGFSPLKYPPSFYFQRQCYILVDPDEQITGSAQTLPSTPTSAPTPPPVDRLKVAVQLEREQNDLCMPCL